VPAAHISIMAAAPHPNPAGHAAHTRSDAGSHSRTSRLPLGHAPEHGTHSAIDARDHVAPDSHAVLVAASHANPASHGQHTAGSVAVQLWSMNSPGGQEERHMMMGGSINKEEAGMSAV